MRFLTHLFLAVSTVLFGGSSVDATNPFFIEKERVDEIISMRGIEVHQLLRELVPVAKSFARPPISNYQVGVAALGKSGNIYLGVNLEFLGCSLHEAVHGEQFLVANARSHGEKELVAIALSAAPCGHCRQFLYEMGGSSSLLILTPDSSTTLSSLLPEPFGPQDLGLEANLMDLGQGSLKGLSSLADKARHAAANSYAPYSASKSGVAIQTKSGAVYTGSYLENAAYNPSLSPLQAALVSLVIGQEEYDSITHVVLAELASSKISQKGSCLHIVQSIAPQAVFERLLMD